MSENKHYTGRLVPVEDKGGVEATAEFLLREKELIDDDDPFGGYDSFEQSLGDDCCGDYIIFNGIIYERKDKKELDACDGYYYVSKPDEDGSMDYDVRFYNGSCDDVEAIEFALQTAHDKTQNLKVGT